MIKNIHYDIRTGLRNRRPAGVTSDLRPDLPVPARLPRMPGLLPLSK